MVEAMDSLEFRARNYVAEEESHALPRSRADTHPLSSPSASASPSQRQQDAIVERGDNAFFDPLRGPDVNAVISNEDVGENSVSSEAATQDAAREWVAFKRVLMQRFPVSKVVSSSPVSNVIMKSAKVLDEALTLSQLEELDDQKKVPEEAAKVISKQEYLSQVHELRDEIKRAWCAEDRVTALKLSIKVARLLMDTSVLKFYPTVFVVATDVLDMLGDMVWERIKQKAEFAEDGSVICSLPNDFETSNICLDAKETCYNWFCKVGSIRELLPRIYLELAILPCWRFLLDQPMDVLQRLVLMIRGIADPLASIYCCLYMVHCAKRFPSCNPGYLVTCIRDIEVVLLRAVSEKVHYADNRKLLFSLIEPSMEYIMKCLLMAASKKNHVANVLEELGLGRDQVESSSKLPRVSIVLHHLLKELPPEFVSSHANTILHLIKCSKDCSFSQALNYRLLGIRLSEERSQLGPVNGIINEVLQVISQYDSLDEYLKVVDAYVDIVLQNELDNHLETILVGIVKLASNRDVVEDELASLQSILVKLLSHFKDLRDVLALNHFLEILDLMYGISRSVVNRHILDLATRNGCIRDPTTMQLLFEISQALHDATEFVNIKDDDNQQSSRLISRFVQMVDHGAEFEQHLTFLVECRRAFSSINEVKETLVHSSNNLATKTLKDGRKHLNFIKSCIAFSEVTIPSVSAPIRQLNLYLETAEVALLGGLISHADGLIDSAIDYLQTEVLMDVSRSPTNTEGMVSTIQKLCSLLVMVPGNCEKEEVMDIPKSILSLICSGSWVTPRVKARVFCAILSLLATLSQDKLPYHSCNSEVTGNDLLFFGDSSYMHELVSSTELILQKLVDCIEQEPSQVARGNMALEACNCIASALYTNDQVSRLCSRFLETAKMCLSANDKHLRSTIKFLDKQLAASTAAAPSIAV